jgi:hypothetical protein
MGACGVFAIVIVGHSGSRCEESSMLAGVMTNAMAAVNYLLFITCTLYTHLKH